MKVRATLYVFMAGVVLVATFVRAQTQDLSEPFRILYRDGKVYVCYPSPAPTGTPRPSDSPTPPASPPASTSPSTTPPPTVPPPTPPAPLNPPGGGVQAALDRTTWPLYHVTTLAHEGPGSIKDGILNGGPAVHIVFDLAGTISYPVSGTASNPSPNWISVKRRKFWIDGFSAPAQGITIRPAFAAPNSCGAGIAVLSGSGDFVIEGIRLVGRWKGETAQNVCQKEGTLSLDADSPSSGPPIDNFIVSRNTFVDNMDAAPDSWGGLQKGTFAWNLWLRNKHPHTVSRPDDLDSKQNQDLTWFQNVGIDNYERNPQWRSCERCESVNNYRFKWRSYAVRFERKNDRFKMHHFNMIGDVFIPGSYNNKDTACVYGDLLKGTPANNGSLARIWSQPIFVSDTALPAGRINAQYHCMSTPSSGGVRQTVNFPVLDVLILPSSMIKQILGKVGMPWRNGDEVAQLDEAGTALP